MQTNGLLTNEFIFTDDFTECCRPEYQDHCLHILCLDGAARFTVGDTIFNVVAGDAIIKSSPKPISDVHRSDNFRISALLISFRFLQAIRPKAVTTSSATFPPCRTP